MGSAPCPRIGSVAKWGTEPLDATAIRENARTPIRKTQAVWESPSPISPMACIWELPKPQGVYGEHPMPPRQTLPLFGRMPEPQSERRKLFGSPQAPYLRWCVFGRMPKPRGVYGERPMPPRQDAAAIRGAEPNQEDASCLGVPKPHISDCVYLGVAQAPGCIWGVPHAPKSGRCRYSGSRTQFFIFHFSFHSP